MVNLVKVFREGQYDLSFEGFKELLLICETSDIIIWSVFFILHIYLSFKMIRHFIWYLKNRKFLKALKEDFKNAEKARENSICDSAKL